MPELSQRVTEVRALAEGLWFLPRPARAPIADKLHGLGYRRHPELATLKVETEGPREFANIAPQHVVKMDQIDRDAGIEFLRGSGNTELADRIESAQTEEQRAAERARLAPKIPESIKIAEEQLARTKPQDLG